MLISRIKLYIVIDYINHELWLQHIVLKLNLCKSYFGEIYWALIWLQKHFTIIKMDTRLTILVDVHRHGHYAN